MHFTRLFFLSLLLGMAASCKKELPPNTSTQNINHDCDEYMEYTDPAKVVFSSPSYYTGISFHEGDTIHIRAISTTTTPLVSSECYVNSMTDGSYLEVIPKDYLTFDLVVDGRRDIIEIEIGGMQLNGYKDGSCGVQQMWRSVKMKVRLNQ